MNQNLQVKICGLNYEGWASLDAIGSSASLLSYWKLNMFEGVLLKKGTNSLTITLTCKSTGFTQMLSNIYGPHTQQERLRLFAELRELREDNNLPWILIGDFNAVRFSSERKGVSKSEPSSRLFNNFVNSQALIELRLSNRNFTWSNFREEPSSARLDRCFVSIDWLNKYPLCSLTPLVRFTSDHTPLMLQITACLQGKPP